MLPKGFTEASLIDGNPVISPKYVQNAWKEAPQEQREEILDWGCQVWWKRGFPYPKLDRAHNRKDFADLAGLDARTLLIPGNIIKINYSGSGTCRNYHPERFSAKGHTSNFGGKSVIDGFQDRKYMRKCIRRCLSELGKLDEDSLQYALRTSGVRLPGNFRPSAAKWVYQTFCEAGNHILDPSAGWGNRALAAFSLPGLNYTGVDPHLEANENNRKMISDLKDLGTTDCTFLDGCAEDIMLSLEGGSYDCVFTSPPYFNLERYDDNSNQSHQRYPEYENWIKNFIGVIISEAHRLLVGGGWFLINVSDTVLKKYPLGRDVFRMAEKYFLHCQTYYYDIQPRANFSEDHRTRREPIFLFKKIGGTKGGYPENPQILDLESMRIF